MDHSSAGEPLLAHEPASVNGIKGQYKTSNTSGGYSFLYALAIAVVGAIVAFNVIRPITVLPRIAPAPGFALYNQDGEMVTSEDLRGHLTLYSFTSTSCDSSCAVNFQQIDDLRGYLVRELPDDVPLSFVSIALDSSRDTVSRSNSYFVKNDISTVDHPIPWMILTGDPERIRPVVGGGFQVYYAEPTDGADTQLTFDPRYVLVDHLGMIRAEYRTAEPDPALVARDIDLILREAENAEGIARLGYEAAHLFLCYPR